MKKLQYRRHTYEIQLYVAPVTLIYVLTNEDPDIYLSVCEYLTENLQVLFETLATAVDPLKIRGKNALEMQFRVQERRGDFVILTYIPAKRKCHVRFSLHNF